MNKVVVTAEEKELFTNMELIFDEILLANGKPYSLLVAGGWVRDKLLGMESNDIDVVIFGVSDLVELEASLARLKNEGGPNAALIQGINLWRKNPEKGKQFDVLLIKIKTIKVEFMLPRSILNDFNLKLGTEPESPLKHDALSRDLTINAMFYDIKLDCVRDDTGLGIEDLQNKILRTPIEAKYTFQADPIRIFRSIRFITKLDGYQLTDEIINYLHTSDCKDTLKHVARERIVTEVTKIIESEQYLVGFDIMAQCNLFNVVFPQNSGGTWTEELETTSTNLLKLLLELGPKLGPRACSKKVIVFSVCLLPLYMKLRKFPFTKWEMVEEWKLDSSTVDDIVLLVESYHFLELFSENIEQLAHDNIVSIGRALRKLGEKWYMSWLLLFFSRYLCGKSSIENFSTEYDSYNAVLRSLSFLGRVPVWKMPPLINGAVLKSKYGLEGPNIGKLLEKMIDWQLLHPNLKKEDCESWLTEELKGQY